MKTALIQQTCSANRAETVVKTISMIKEAASKGAKLICLQELHTGPYFCQSENVELFELAESIPGVSTDEFGKVAKELGVVIVLSLFEKRAAGLYHNTAVVLEKDGTIAGVYRKMHIPDDPAFYEKFYFTPGDMGFNPIKTSLGNLGVLVCWDQWYPEGARIMAMNGADILIYPTAIGYNPDDAKDEQIRQRDAWIISQRAHAVANGLPVVSINRVGHEADTTGVCSGITFWGNSFAAGPQGEFLAHASEENEEIIICDIDLKRSENVRRWWPFFRDRRIDAYGDILKRWGK
ncbi:MAG: carbon-nitrogen hydrolase [Campylobacterales bacterium]|nr:carbon-nitrogen hydrolase [Campylobacterales bacterium]